jgi:hypothetical protein
MPVTLSKTLPYASTIERRIATKLVNDALAAGYSISVYDGEEWALRSGKDAATVLAAMGSTDMDKLRFRDADDNIIGTVLLIWGNEDDLISDTSESPEMDRLTGQPA